MTQDFIKVAACSPALKVGDCRYNTQQMLIHMRDAAQRNVKLITFPELSVTGYSCGDLFFQQSLIDGAWQALEQLVRDAAGLDLIAVVGLPIQYDSHLYNCAAVIHCAAADAEQSSEEMLGRSLAGLVVKRHLTPYERRWFSPMNADRITTSQSGLHTRLGGTCLFRVPGYPNFALGVEICNDLWVDEPPPSPTPYPSSHGDLCAAGATVVVNLASSTEGLGKAATRRTLVAAHTIKNSCAYIYSASGPDESTTDSVCGGHRIIAECGDIIAEAEPFSPEVLTVTDIDLGRIAYARRRSGHPAPGNLYDNTLYLELSAPTAPLTRALSPLPFVTEAGADQPGQWQHIIDIQAHGLKKRMLHTGCKTAVLGISGGLDSTHALVATCRAYDLMGLDRSGIAAYTLPCFGTTDMTKSNAYKLCQALGIPLGEIDISAAVRQHFVDIEQGQTTHDAAFENAQARERTQVLMDIANQKNGLVVGTGDLSELALGWATYNGDHMSMYSLNGGMSKTLIRYVLGQLADTTDNPALSQVLAAILETPISPELLPAKDGQIAQKTEDLVGPYELHDFFLFHALTRGAGPSKILTMACRAFDGVYDAATIHKWLTTFFRRFFSQQFKRSTMPDGVGLGIVDLSPRGGLSLPSDASWAVWQAELEAIRP